MAIYELIRNVANLNGNQSNPIKDNYIYEGGETEEDNIYIQGHHPPSMAPQAQTPAKPNTKNANDSTMKKNKNEKRHPATDEKNINQAQK